MKNYHNKTISSLLLKRGQYRCEYCHSEITIDNSMSFESDHVFPASLGGVDDHSNRALACPNCNRLKSNATFGKDPDTGRRARMFNPRTDKWEHHFEKSALTGVVLGKTPIGRVTVDLLNLHLQFDPAIYYINDKDLWDLDLVGNTIEADRFPVLDKIRMLRAYRLSCKFNVAIDYGNMLLQHELVRGSRARSLIEFVIWGQIFECYYTTSENETQLLSALRSLRTLRKRLYGKLPDVLWKRFSEYEASLQQHLSFVQNSNHRRREFMHALARSNIREATKAYALAQLGMPLPTVLRTNASDYLKRMDDLRAVNIKEYMREACGLAGLMTPALRLFKGKDADLALSHIIRAVNIARTEYGFDIALIVYLQRRAFEMELRSEIAGEVMPFEEVVRIARQHKLYNEIRHLRSLSLLARRTRK